MKTRNNLYFGHHLAYIAKELIADNEAKLNNLTFVTTTIDIVGSTASDKTISRGYTEERLNEVRKLIEEIGSMHAFCAWVREAIKAKEEELDAVKNKDYDQLANEQEFEPIESPLRLKYSSMKMDEEDIISEIPQLAFDHEKILRVALKRLKERIHFQPIGFELLPEVFTMPQLQALYEAILEVHFDRRNFANKMLKLGILKETGDRSKNAARSVPIHYRFNPDKYKEMKSKCFRLEF